MVNKRGRKPIKNPRKYPVMVLFNLDEFEAITNMVSHSGEETKSTWIRKKLFDKLKA